MAAPRCRQAHGSLPPRDRSRVPWPRPPTSRRVPTSSHLLERGYVHQCSDFAGVDEAAPRGPADGLCRLRLHGAVAASRPPALDHDAALAPGDRRQAGGADGRRHDARRRPSGRDETRKILTWTRSRPTRPRSARPSPLPRFRNRAQRRSDGRQRRVADTLNYIEMLRDIGRHFSVNRMLSMDSVRLRLERDQELSFLEFNYMILQAYDFAS